MSSITHTGIYDLTNALSNGLSHDLSNSHDSYHAHFYFDESSLALATALRTTIRDELGLEVGNLNTRLVGPHPQWSFAATFSHDAFDTFVPWIKANRQELTVLIHAVTGDDLIDHTEHVHWLGSPIKLDLSGF